MITIFSIPKIFEGHIDIIQRNAVDSWIRLVSPSNIYLLGNEKGVGEICEDRNINHIPDINVNEFGTPLLGDAFKSIAKHAGSKYVCYINSDIILLSDFLEAIHRIDSIGRFCMIVGRRLDVSIRERINFLNPSVEEGIRRLAGEEGKLRSSCWIDYFIFRGGQFSDMPPFAVGRPRWDNWMIGEAVRRGMVIIDATEMITAVHQNHDYSHIKNKYGGNHSDRTSVWRGVEAQRNHLLGGGWLNMYTIADAHYLVTRTGLRPKYTSGAVWRYYNLILHSLFSWTFPFVDRMRRLLHSYFTNTY